METQLDTIVFVGTRPDSRADFKPFADAIGCLNASVFCGNPPRTVRYVGPSWSADGPAEHTFLVYALPPDFQLPDGRQLPLYRSCDFSGIDFGVRQGG